MIEEQRRYRRLVRNMRRANELFGRLVGCEFAQKRGHTYRLVPAKAFDEALEMLRKMGGEESGAR